MQQTTPVLRGLAAVLAVFILGCDKSKSTDSSTVEFADPSALKSRPQANSNTKTVDAKPRTKTVDAFPGTKTAKAKQPATKYMLRVMVFDDTEKKPIHQKAEVQSYGGGSWFIKEPTKFGSAAKDLVAHEVNIKNTIHIYPEGRDGHEIVVKFMMTKEMNPKGNPRDSLSIDIADDEITVFGLPLKAATGEIEKKFKR